LSGKPRTPAAIVPGRTASVRPQQRRQRIVDSALARAARAEPGMTGATTTTAATTREPPTSTRAIPAIVHDRVPVALSRAAKPRVHTSSARMVRLPGSIGELRSRHELERLDLRGDPSGSRWSILPAR